LITLIPHHIPRMIGFSSANRVDMDEFAQGAALIGTQKALTTIADGVNRKTLISSGVQNEGRNDQRMIGSDANGRRDNSPTNGNSSSGIDTTVQATMDMGGGRRETEDD
jgi:hypothetical protein